MPSRRKYKPKFVANALKANMGMVYVTARKIGCSHQMIYNYIEAYDEVREAYEEQSGMMVDTAEVKFYEAIRAGEAWAINKMLSTKGRKRGYQEEKSVKMIGDREKPVYFVDAEARRQRIADLQAKLGNVSPIIVVDAQ